MANAGIVWDAPPADVIENAYQAQVAALRSGIWLYLSSLTPQLRAFMKGNARWTDRTGMARSTLWSDLVNFQDGEIMVMEFGHGVHYGIYLEFSNQGRYQILGTTMDTYVPIVGAGVQVLVNTIFGDG